MLVPRSLNDHHRSTERRFIKAAQLARMQGVELAAHQVHGSNADFQMLADRALIEGIGRTWQFDFTVQRFVRHTQQRAIRDAQAITLGSNGAAFHVHGNSTGQVDQRTFLSPAQLPVAIVIGQYGAGTQAFFQLIAALTGNLCGSLLQCQLDFSQGRNRNVRRHDPSRMPSRRM